MKSNTDKQDETLDWQHPLLQQISALAADVTGSRLTAVYPEASDWGEVRGDDTGPRRSAFCKSIQSSKEGARHCRMCHILMAVAACNGGPMEQRCHAGATVLVCPANQTPNASIAVLSSCLYTERNAWDEVQQRGAKLGIDRNVLRKAFLDLPHPDERMLRRLRTAMQTMSHAIMVLQENRNLTAQIRKQRVKPDPIANLERFIGNPSWINPIRRQGLSENTREPSLLVHVVRELVKQRPDLPLTVKELSVAARLTPNHFSTLFREQTGCSFNAYLTEQRITRAKKLLRNPTLTVNTIARMVGYDDPGYFTRRFHQATRHAPREWRNREASKAG